MALWFTTLKFRSLKNMFKHGLISYDDKIEKQNEHYKKTGLNDRHFVMDFEKKRSKS